MWWASHCIILLNEWVFKCVQQPSVLKKITEVTHQYKKLKKERKKGEEKTKPCGKNRK